MNLDNRINALSQLGEFLASQNHHAIFDKAYIHNNWFTQKFVANAFIPWSDLLSPNNLYLWTSNYPIKDQKEVKTILIIMAGNIPLVGFHDLLSVLICGHKALVKLSSNDTIIPKYIIDELIRIEPGFADLIVISDNTIGSVYDAVIATGSNNSNRYFEYYFKNKSNLLRGNRNSLAILNGDESKDDLEKLADDVFMYFGLGCRNVSKLMLPRNFNFEALFEAFEKYVGLIEHNKYANNYTYHKAILLMNQTPHLDNGFILLKEDKAIASPLGVLFYEFYDTENEIDEIISKNKENIQCIVSKDSNNIQFGQAQYPKLSDYADGKDTIEFLCSL